MLFNDYAFLLVFLPASLVIYRFADPHPQWRIGVLVPPRVRLLRLLEPTVYYSSGPFDHGELSRRTRLSGDQEGGLYHGSNRRQSGSARFFQYTPISSPKI